MIVLDQITIGGNVYGYCSCGRELKKTSIKVKCPLCERELQWEEEDAQGKDETSSDKEGC